MAKFPQVSIQVTQADDDTFSLAVRGNVAKIEASSLRAAAFAKAQLAAGLEANRLGECVGSSRPLYALRPLWITEHATVEPEALFDLGCNAVILPYGSARYKAFKDHHIMVGVACKALDFAIDADFIVWQQDALYALGVQHPLKHATPFERAQFELAELRKYTDKKILYCTRPGCPFLLALMPYVKNECIIFDAIGSSLFTDLARHPVCEKTPFMPLVHINQRGAVSDMPFLEIESCFGRQKEARFAGAVVQASTLFEPSAIGQLPIWVASQRLIRPTCVPALIEFWLDRYHPSWHALLMPKLAGFIHQLFSDESFDELGKRVAECSQYLMTLKAGEPDQELLVRTCALFSEQSKKYFSELAQQALGKIPLSLQKSPLSVK